MRGTLPATEIGGILAASPSQALAVDQLKILFVKEF